MRLYKLLSGIGFLSKNYSFKFLFIAFLGIHIPLIGIILYLVFKPESSISSMSMFVLTLILTLGATAVTLLLLNQLLAPVKLSEKTLVNYIERNLKPELPAGYKDEVGVLMQSVQHTIEKVQLLDSERNDLISLLSHDLRTPLTQVISLNKLIKQEEDPASIKEYADMIDHCLDYQLKLLENIFLILKLKDYEIRNNDFSPVNLSALVNKQVKLIENKAVSKIITIESFIDQNIEVNVKEVLFERIIFNLLTNAVKFSYAGGKITIEAHRSDDQTFLTIKDSGIGFHQDNAESLFERFTPSGRKGTNGEPSEGLGLYLCRKIIEQHKGSISATSEGPNKGSSFTITLPYLS